MYDEESEVLESFYLSLCLFHFSSRVSYFLDAQLSIHMIVAFFLEGNLCD